MRFAIGVSFLRFRQLEPAAEHLEEALRLFRQVLGEADDDESIGVLQHLAWVRLRQDRLDESERLHEDALRRSERTLPEEHVVRLTASDHYAFCLSRLKKFGPAEDLFHRAIAARLKAEGETLDLQMVRNNLALTYRWQGRLDDAEPVYLRALAEHRRLGGDTHPNTVLLLQNLARLHIAQQRYSDALLLLEEALAGERKGFGNIRPGELVNILMRLETVYAELGRWADAEGAARNALDTSSQKQPFALDVRADFLARIGSYQYRQSQFSTAEKTLRECLNIREKTQPEIWNTFDSQSLLGAALLGQKKYSEAEPLLLKGYEGMIAREKTIPPQGQIRIPEALDRVIWLYVATDRPAEAQKYRELRAKYPKEPAPKPRVKLNK